MTFVSVANNPFFFFFRVCSHEAAFYFVSIVYAFIIGDMYVCMCVCVGGGNDQLQFRCKFVKKKKGLKKKGYLLTLNERPIKIKLYFSYFK